MGAIPQRTTRSLVSLFSITKVEYGASLLYWIAGVSRASHRSLVHGRDHHGIRRPLCEAVRLSFQLLALSCSLAQQQYRDSSCSIFGTLSSRRPPLLVSILHAAARSSSFTIQLEARQ